MQIDIMYNMSTLEATHGKMEEERNRKCPQAFISANAFD